MRFALPVAAALVLLAPLARGDDDKDKKDTTTKLPINPVADAKAGDWSSYLVVQTNEAGESKRAVRCLSVASVEDGVVNLESDERGEHARKRPYPGNPLSVKDAPTVAKFFGEEPENVSAPTDEKLTIEGQAFECKKITFTTGKKSWTVWLSSVARGSGVVAVKVTREKNTMKIELAGYGTKGKTQWGKTIDELEKVLAKEKAAETILKALKDDDKATFRKCITKRILDKVAKTDEAFDEYFAIWKKGVETRGFTPQMPAEHVKMAEEDGEWKIDER